MKRHERQGLGESQSFCAYSLWNQGTSPSEHISVFTNQNAPLNFGIQSVY